MLVMSKLHRSVLLAVFFSGPSSVKNLKIKKKEVFEYGVEYKF